MPVTNRPPSSLTAASTNPGSGPAAPGTGRPGNTGGRGPAHPDLRSLRDRRHRETRQELAELSAGKSPTPMPLHEQQTAGYLQAREAVQRPITDPGDLRRLKDSNQTLHEIRQALHHGRGNVTTDLEQSHGEGHYRAQVGYAIWKNDPPKAQRSPLEQGAIGAASTLALGAGNCDQNAIASAYLHASRLQVAERIDVVTTAVKYHTWSELQKRNRPTVVIDPWGEGPAMHKEDSVLRRFETRPLGQLLKRDANEAVAELQRYREGFASAQGSRTLEQMVEQMKARRAPPVDLHPPTNFVSPEFAQRASEGLHAHSPLTNEIAAVHIARTQFGAGIKPATEAAAKIVENADNLGAIQRGPLPRSPGEP